MSSTFGRWEKDPFFYAAEEVQQSADRMESIYRRWRNERKQRSSDEAGDAQEEDVAGELRRELCTALGTAKWQLEELDRASKERDMGLPEGDEAKIRHMQFVSVIGSQVLKVEDFLKESGMEKGKPGLLWVHLDEGERDELVDFLSGPPVHEKVVATALGEKLNSGGTEDCEAKNPHKSRTQQMTEEKIQAHRRTASAGNDSGAWAISLLNEDSPRRSFDDRAFPPRMPKVFSMSRLAGAIDSTANLKLPKNGFRKWKHADQLNSSESIPLQNPKATRGSNPCHERTKGCIEGCSNESYNKRLYGWIGALQRQLQRSQYQIQYARPLQMIFWMVVTLLLIVLFVLRAI